MALVNCPECRAEVSETASACPQCGFKLKKSKVIGVLKLLVGIPLGIFGLMVVFRIVFQTGPSFPAPQADADRQECVRAMMSNMGTSTRNYSDKLAYEAHVREKCKGFEIDGRPVMP